MEDHPIENANPTTCNFCNQPNHFATVYCQTASTNSLITHVQDPTGDLFTSSPSTIQEIPADITPITARTHQGSATTANIFPDSGANLQPWK